MTSSILVVDDDEDILELFKLMLEFEGYNVDTAKCGIEALKKASSNEYYLALLDFILPDIKGTEVAKELLKMERIREIIFITGYQHIYNFIDPMIEKISRVLFKPVSGDLLIRSVREILEPEPLLVDEIVTII